MQLRRFGSTQQVLCTGALFCLTMLSGCMRDDRRVLGGPRQLQPGQPGMVNGDQHVARGIQVPESPAMRVVHGNPNPGNQVVFTSQGRMLINGQQPAPGQPGTIVQQPGTIQQPGVVVQQPGTVIQQQPGTAVQQPGVIMSQQLPPLMPAQPSTINKQPQTTTNNNQVAPPSNSILQTGTVPAGANVSNSQLRLPDILPPAKPKEFQNQGATLPPLDPNFGNDKPTSTPSTIYQVGAKETVPVQPAIPATTIPASNIPVTPAPITIPHIP